MKAASLELRVKIKRGTTGRASFNLSHNLPKTTLWKVRREI